MFLFSLRSRLIVLILIALLPGIFLTLFVANSQRQAALRGVEAQNLSTLRSAALAQSLLVASTRTLLTTLAASPVIVDGDRAGCNALLANTLKSVAGYRTFSVSDRTGKSWCRAPNPEAGVDNSQGKFFLRTLAAKDFSVGGYEIDPVSNRGKLSFGFPVLNERGEVQQVVHAGLDTDSLNSSIDALQLPAGYVVDILDREGTYVVRWPSPDDYVGRRFSDKSIIQQILQQSADGEEHSAEMTGVEGTQRLYAFKRVAGVPDNDIFVNVGIEPGLAYAGINAALRQNLLALGFFMLLTMAVAWVLADSLLLKPVSSIARAAKQITNGNLHARTRLKYDHGELGLLARDFDLMCSDLQKRSDELTRLNAELEQRVHVRTDQLQTAIDKLRESREQLRLLSHHQREMLEEEQTRLSREVHDQIGQALTGLKMDLSTLQKRVVAEISTPTRAVTDKIKSMVELIDEAIQTTRAIARRLRPTVLDDLGLGAAMDWQASDFQQRNGIACNVVNHNVADGLDRNVATAAYRIVQEALTNVTRHAHATEVLIELEHRADGLNIQVRDNGKGVAAGPLNNQKSLGLLGMRERARDLGGTITLQSAEGQGAVLIAMLPLSRASIQETI